MSDIVEKTLASLPSLIAGGLSPVSRSISSSSSKTRPTTVYSGLGSFVDSMSKCSSQHEVDHLIKRELDSLKQRLSQADISQSQIKESLIKCIFCYLMGHDVTFGHIYAVKLAQQGTLLQKRVGYLACILFFNEDSDMVIMLVNTIQRDLQSTNIMENCLGMIAAGRLISPEMIPSILPLVEEKLNHQKTSVRKKAVLCLHSFYTKAPPLLDHSSDKFKKALCDKEPDVMWAALQIFHDLIKANPTEHRDIVPSLLYILQQVIHRKLPLEYEYHGVPAPWLQIQLLQCLAVLGRVDVSSSQEIFPVLTEVLQKIDPTQRMGLAVIYECVRTITTIQPYPELLESAVKCITKFLSAKHINLRYLGIKCLALIVQINPSYAVEHQHVVIECLDHSDLSVRKKVLDLLYRMANVDNVKVICMKLMENIDLTSDPYVKADLVGKTMELADRCSCDIEWYVTMVTSLIQTAGSLISSQMINQVISCIKGALKSQPQFQTKIVEYFWSLLDAEVKQDKLLMIIAWCLGEYSHQSCNISAINVLEKLKFIFNHPNVELSTQNIVITAITKVSVQTSASQQHITDNLNIGSGPNSPEIKMRLREVSLLSEEEEYLQQVITYNNGDMQIDSTLTFLDSYVCEKLEKGNEPYKPRHLREQSPSKIPETAVFSELIFQPYESPQHTSGDSTTHLSHSLSVSSSGSKGDGTENSEPSLKLNGVQRVWDKSGVRKQDDTAATEKRSPSSHNSSPYHSPRRSSPEVNLDPEEEEKKKELASALFGGLSPKRSTSMSPR